MVDLHMLCQTSQPSQEGNVLCGHEVLEMQDYLAITSPLPKVKAPCKANSCLNTKLWLIARSDVLSGAQGPLTPARKEKTRPVAVGLFLVL